MPRPAGAATQRASFQHDLNDWFEALFSTEPRPMQAVPQVVEASQPEFGGDLSRFARETILWGRKSGTMLAKRRTVEVPGKVAEPACS
jgi:hypothetical protein